MTDCVQCREWELCPFHPKEEPATVPYVDEFLATMFPEEAWHLTIPVSSDSTHTVTDDGQYVQTWRGGVLVDEEPIEAYQS